MAPVWVWTIGGGTGGLSPATVGFVATVGTSAGIPVAADTGPVGAGDEPGLPDVDGPGGGSYVVDGVNGTCFGLPPHPDKTMIMPKINTDRIDRAIWLP